MVLGVPGTPGRVLHLHALGHAGIGGPGLVLGVGGVQVRASGAAGLEERSAEREELGLVLVQQASAQLGGKSVQLTAHLHRAGEQGTLTRSVEISGTQTQKHAEERDVKPRLGDMTMISQHMMSQHSYYFIITFSISLVSLLACAQTDRS